MPTYHNLAHGTKALSLAPGFPWPYDIDICFDDVPYPVGFSEGVAHGAAACMVSAAGALEERWQEYFAITNAEWLLPHLARLAEGVPLPREQILKEYFDRHGVVPRNFESVS